MKAIVQFDDLERVALRFRQVHLEPRLNEGGVLPIVFRFEDYIDRAAPGVPPRNPRVVADSARSWWLSTEPEPEKTVWIFDLDETGSNTPDRSYGLCVLSFLGQALCAGSVEDFLNRDSFLSVILTLHPGNLVEGNSISGLPRPSCNLSALGRSWPDVKKIRNKRRDRLVVEETSRAVDEARQPGPRIVLANSGGDEAWLALVVANWLK